MHTSLPQFTRFTGIGPIVIPEASRLSNQQEIIDSLISIIERLSKTAPPPTVNSESPHHVLSILGGRGTGKTSLLLTIVKQLRLGKNNALTLDLLQADQLREAFPVVPAIVALAENLIMTNFNSDLARNFILQHSLPLKKLAWATRSPELLQALSRDTLNLSDWNTRMFELIGQPTDLPGKFREWVTALLAETRKSVLVVPIDDTDISIDKASEVIDAIRIYFSDPRIVTIVAADMESLERRIRNTRLAALPHIPELKPSKDDDEESSFLFGLSSAKYQSQEALAEQQYVESLLVKVLPLATRHTIRPIPPSARVGRQFFLPGQADFQSLYDVIAAAEVRLGAKESILATLLLRHSDLLSDNLRTFANQFAMIRGLCASAMPDATSETEWELHARNTYHAQILESHGGAEWMRITSFEQYSLSRLHADIVHSILSSNEFRSLEEGVSVSQRVQLRELPTLHEIAAATLDAVRMVGVRSEPSGRRLIYQVLSRKVSDSPGSSFVDFCFDYALTKGADIETLAQVTNIRFEGLLNIRYPIPFALFGELRNSAIRGLSPIFQLVANPRSKTVGGDLLINVSRDRLAPTFVQDSLDIGAFAGRIPANQRNEYQEKLLRMADEISEDEDVDERAELIARAFLNLVGSVTLDAFMTLDAAIQSVTRQGQGIQSHFYVEWTEESAWLLRIVEHFHGTLADVISATQLPWHKRVELLCFISDLPFEHLHNCTPSVNLSICDNLRSACGVFLDELTGLGLLERRGSGEISLGSLKLKPQSNVPLLFVDSLHNFPSISVERRTSSLRSLIAVIGKIAPTPFWDYRVEAPPIWQKLRDEIRDSYRRNTKKKSRKTRRKPK